jgi:hypothetical protein
MRYVLFDENNFWLSYSNFIGVFKKKFVTNEIKNIPKWWEDNAENDGIIIFWKI